MPGEPVSVACRPIVGVADERDPGAHDHIVLDHRRRAYERVVQDARARTDEDAAPHNCPPADHRLLGDGGSLAYEDMVREVDAVTDPGTRHHDRVAADTYSLADDRRVPIP